MRPCKQEHGNDGNSDRCCGCHQCTTDNDQRRNRKHDKGPGFRSNRANCYIVASRRCRHQNCHFRAVALQRILQSPASRVGQASNASTGPPNGGSKLAGGIGRSSLPERTSRPRRDLRPETMLRQCQVDGDHGDVSCLAARVPAYGLLSGKSPARQTRLFVLPVIGSHG